MSQLGRAYRPRDPQAPNLWRLLDEHFDSFPQVYDQRYQAKYGGSQMGSGLGQASLWYADAMPRPLRPIEKGLIYHVINRGNNRQDVFSKPGDYEAFLQAIRDLKERRPFEFYGYCLMTNHIHLLIKPLETTISRVMQSLLVSHTQRYHRHHRSGGHVWQGRFKSPVVQDDEHLLTVLRYIEANPLRARMVRWAENYRWSSFRTHGPGEQNDLLDTVVPYEQMATYAKVRERKWDDYVHQPLVEKELQAIRRSVATGLLYGSAAWIKKLSRKLNLDLNIRPRGRPKQEPIKDK